MRALLLSVLVLSVIAAACGDDGDGSGDDTDEATAAPTDPPGTTAAPEPTDPPGTTAAPEPTDPPGTTAAPEPPTTAPRPEIPTPEVSDLEGLLALDRPVVLAHAGGDRSWPHSTMYAFTRAALGGADALEMDVQLTGDGVLVVQHDDTVDRTTETTGRVRDLTYEELQALDSGYWWSEEWSSQDLPEEAYVYRGVRTGDVDPPEGFTADDFRVETFRAVAEAFPDHVLDVEIKIPRGDDGESDLDFAIEGARVLAEEIEELGRTDSVIVVSFDEDVIAAFRELAPDVATSPELNGIVNWFLGADLQPSDRVLQVPPENDGIDVLSDLLFEKVAADDLAVWVWPPGSQEDADSYQQFIELGADGVIAGRPDEAVTRFAEMAGG